MRLRRLAAAILHASGVFALRRRWSRRWGRYAIVFHGVSSRDYADLPEGLRPHLTQGDLDRALSWIGRHFDFLEPQEFLAGSRPGVLVTFDDGFANQLYQALPVLHRHSAPAVFFVPTQHVRAPRDWLGWLRSRIDEHWGHPDEVPEAVARDLFDGLSASELVALAADPLATIGAHSDHHPLLTTVGTDELTAELAGPCQELGDCIDQPIDLLAYPSGDYDLRVAQAARAVGYRAAFALRPLPVGLPSFEIPRVDLYQAGGAYLAAKLSGWQQPPSRGPQAP